MERYIIQGMQENGTWSDLQETELLSRAYALVACYSRVYEVVRIYFAHRGGQ